MIKHAFLCLTAFNFLKSNLDHITTMLYYSVVKHDSTYYSVVLLVLQNTTYYFVVLLVL